MGEEAKLQPDDIPAGKDATIDEMVAFLRRVGAIDKCPICKTDEWTFPNRDNGGVIYLLNPSSPSHLMAVPAYVMVCNNCSFIRLHAKRVIDKKISSISEKIADGK